MIKEMFLPLWNWYSASCFWNIRNDKTLKILKPRKNLRWYLQVQIKWKNKSVHRLVAQAFYWEDSRQVNHKDGNKENNKIWNLEYLTISENVKHAHENWLRKSNLIWWNKK